ncbi:MAG: hypothetical protein U5M23_04345 [Marinagarivorans sp.]|nr:hypothetical protein [Marinagarivorans sp.]
MRIRHIGSDRGDIEYIYDDKAIIDEVVSGTSTPVAQCSGQQKPDNFIGG